VVGGWAVFNFLLVGAAMRAVAERQQRRQVPRVPVNVPATLAAGDPNAPVFLKATVVDASTSGARIVIRQRASDGTAGLPPLAAGDIFWFTPEFPRSPHLENAVRAQVKSVRHEGGALVLGVAYDPTQPMTVRETVAHMIFGDSASWEAVRAMRNAKMPLLKGIAYVLRLSVQGIWHTLRALAAEPARRRRKKIEQVKAGVTPEGKPVHLLAFGETFDPPPPSRTIDLMTAQIAAAAAAAAPGAADPRAPNLGAPA
jgi:cellulose synthase (UDP-forming)